MVHYDIYSPKLEFKKCSNGPIARLPHQAYCLTLPTHFQSGTNCYCKDKSTTNTRAYAAYVKKLAKAHYVSTKNGRHNAGIVHYVAVLGSSFIQSGLLATGTAKVLNNFASQFSFSH